VVWLLNPYVLKDHSAFIFRLKQSKKNNFLDCLDPQDEGTMIPQNIRKYSPKNKALHPRRLHLHFVLYKLSLSKMSFPLTLGQYCLISKSLGQKDTKDKYVSRTAQALQESNIAVIMSKPSFSTLNHSNMPYL